MPLPGGELVHRMVDRLYAATTTKEAHLCKVALEALVDADIKGCAFATSGGTNPEKVVEEDTFDVAE